MKQTIIPGPDYDPANQTTIDRDGPVRASDIVLPADGEVVELSETIGRVLQERLFQGINREAYADVDRGGIAAYQAVQQGGVKGFYESDYLETIPRGEYSEFDIHLQDLLMDAVDNLDEEDTSWTVERVLEVLADFAVRNVGRERSDEMRTIALESIQAALPREAFNPATATPITIPAEGSFELPTNHEDVIGEMWAARFARELDYEFSEILGADGFVESITAGDYDLTDKCDLSGQVTLSEDGQGLQVRLYVCRKPDARLTGPERIALDRGQDAMVKLVG